jgi:hypothetical protein
MIQLHILSIPCVQEEIRLDSASPPPTSAVAEGGLPSATTAPVPKVLQPAAPDTERKLPALAALEA